ncbi:MAG: hypothetical protein GY805_18055 [Chloroflexi bacterium]|nr:hypothetical protein [Chloroflexota bacterium]
MIILFFCLSPATIFPLGDEKENVFIEPTRFENEASASEYSAVGCFQQDCHLNMVNQTRQHTHAPFEKGQCDYCHDMPPSHAENSEYTVRHVASLRDIEVYEGCHLSSTLGSSHPVGGIDPQTGGLMTCTSTCHDPHTASNEKMLRHPNTDGLCLLCHEFGQ